MPQTFLDDFPQCKNVLKDQHVLFDANVIISLLDNYNADFLDFLESLGVIFVTIHPVLVELMATNNPKKRIQRQTVINRYKFYSLPLTKNELDNARDIQSTLATMDCFPEPTDLYLAGMLSKYGNKIFLATSNLSDFPNPLFVRKCFAVVQNDRHANLISFLQIDNSKLIRF